MKSLTQYLRGKTTVNANWPFKLRLRENHDYAPQIAWTEKGHTLSFDRSRLWFSHNFYSND
jgi:hypothetical protein